MINRRLIGLKENLLSQRENYFLWIPVFFATGIWGYFSLLFEPPFWSGIALLCGVVFLLLIIRKRIHHIEKYIIIYLMFGCLGFSVAQLKSHYVASPVIAENQKIQEVTGRVARVETRPNGPRVWVDNLYIKGLETSKTPKYIRVTFGRNVELAIADEIRFRARLRPPPAPSIAGGYDFQRRAWFEQLGGVGFSFGAPDKLLDGNDVRLKTSLWLVDLRKVITDNIIAIVPGEAGAVTAALISGDRSAITEETHDIMRHSGLAHLLAISGLHMGLVAAVLFFCIRLFLALSEKLALHYPIKKWAAFGAIPGSLAYLLIAGAPLPTQRAFIMTVIILIAVIFDRVALSMRLVAIAAIIVLLIYPESLFSASFQMSFAAVTALIALFDSKFARDFRIQMSEGVFKKAIGYFLALSASTIVASIATMPFAIYHFSKIADYGLLGNLLAVPVMAFWVMPWAVISMLLMPLNLAEIGLVPMGWGVSIILDIAAYVSALPGSFQMIPAISNIALAGLVFAGLWLCLWRGVVRYYLLPLAVIALVYSVLVSKPDIIVSADGNLIAIRSEDKIMLSNLRKNRFEAENWQQSTQWM